MPVQRYTKGGVTVTYDSDKCAHAGRCVKGLPAVFDMKKKPWIDPAGATPDQIAAQVAQCPSGALALEPGGRQ
jgi:uncharacterized Fe-S cluster protein YjdI